MPSVAGYGYFPELHISENDLRTLPSMARSPYYCMPDIKLLAEGVMKQLLNIKVDKASGPDLIPARILLEAASELAVVLTPVFEQSEDF